MSSEPSTPTCAQGAPRLRLRWPNMIDTLSPRIKICGHSSTLPTTGCGDGVHCRKKYLGTESRGKRSTVNIRTILSVATVAVGLVSAGLAANYDALIRQGYRWVAVDGPLACVSKDDLRQMVEKPSDELTLKMVEEVRAYYLIRGSVVRVVLEEKSSGLSQISIPGIRQNLWTLTKFLTKQPIKDIIGRIETPGMLEGATATLTASPAPTESPMPTPGQ